MLVCGLSALLATPSEMTMLTERALRAARDAVLKVTFLIAS
jgi:hypothetical protein